MAQPVAKKPRDTACVSIDKSDLIAAWCLLENLAVSVDQIGGALPDEAGRRAALAGYMSPELIRQINDARMRLSRYLSDEEAEDLSEKKIAYWDYREVKAAK